MFLNQQALSSALLHQALLLRPILSNSGVGTWSEHIVRMIVRADQGAQCSGSLKGFAEGEGPRPAGIAVADVSAQIDAIVLGEIEADAQAAARQKIFRGE